MSNDPGIGQGRPHHDPQRDRDIVLVLLLVLASAAAPIALLWFLAKAMTP